MAENSSCRGIWCLRRPGELLSLYRPQLETLLAGEGRSGLTASPLRSNTTAAAKARKKRSAARKEAESDYEVLFHGTD